MIKLMLHTLSYDNKHAELNRLVLSFPLKTSTDLVHLTSNSKEFQSLGAAQVKDLSPSAALHMKLG